MAVINKTDEKWTFFRQWLKNPVSVAAILPSSPQLARRMMAELSEQTTRVIELGGGTGVFTQALLEFGIKPSDLLVLEINKELHQHLQNRFPEVHVAYGDAREIFNIAKTLGFTEKKADAVVSGLGFLSMPKQSQLDIISAAFDCMKPDGRLVQFTYGPADPVACEVLETLALNSRRASYTWWNVPPATVYVYHRRVLRELTHE